MTLDLGHFLLAISITCWMAIAWDSSFPVCAAVDAQKQKSSP
jgi:hypothetical protein